MRYYHLATREPTRTAGTTSACAPRRSASCLLLCKEESFCFPSKLPSSNEEGTESSPSEARTQGWSRRLLESRNMCAAPSLPEPPLLARLNGAQAVSSFVRRRVSASLQNSPPQTRRGQSHRRQRRGLRGGRGCAPARKHTLVTHLPDPS